MPPTEETEFGLLLTPTTREEVQDLEKFKKRMEKYPNGTTMQNLATQIMGLLPTPTASEAERGSERQLTVKEGKVQNISPKGVKYGMSIRQLAEQGFIPTPMASDATTGAIIGKNDIFVETKGLPRKINQNGTDGSVGLARLVTMLNTPTASDKNGGVTRPTEKLQYGTSLVNQIHGLTNATAGKTSQLNPQFVMEMMGFPTDWTELPFLNGETNQSKQEEMQ
jgi:hypothetical protein